MNFTEQDIRLMASTRDRLLMEQIEEAELATTREEAFHASYNEVADKLAVMTMRYEECRRALWGAVALAGAFFVIALAGWARAW